MTDESAEISRLLLVEDDDALIRILSRVLGQKGFEVRCASDVAEALTQARVFQPSHALVDLRLAGGDSGLNLILPLKELNPEIRIVVLTGYASITTAIDAIKLGAIYYLPKPVDMEAILNAFDQVNVKAESGELSQPLSVRRLEWEHIQRVLAEHQGNVSAAARSLNMHRRTLQRKLAKRATRQ